MGAFSFLGRMGNDALGVSDSIEQQQKFSWKMWNANNAYNHPKEQVKRLEEAGLNPMLVYGNGSVAGNTSSAVGAGSGSGNSAMSSILSFLNSRAGRSLQEQALAFEEQRLYQNLELGQAQIEQVEASKASVLADIAIKQHNLKVARDTGSFVGDSSKYGLGVGVYRHIKGGLKKIYDDLPKSGKGGRDYPFDFLGI